MADVANRLPSKIEASAEKREFYSTELVRTDGGHQHSNERWADLLAEWDITVPLIRRGSAEYVQLKAWFAAVKGSGRTFDFHDVEACEDVEVRVKGDMISWQLVGNLLTVSMTLEMAR